MGDYEGAADAYQTGLYYDPSLIPLYVNLGSLYTTRNQPTDARLWLLKALKQEISVVSAVSPSIAVPFDDPEIDNYITTGQCSWHTEYEHVSPALLNNLGLAELTLHKHNQARYYFEWAVRNLQVQGDSSSYIWNTVQDNLNKIIH